jgi:hypothetical protein
MNAQKAFEAYQAEREQALKSAILAKAVIRTARRTLIVVVLAGSTRQEFYVVFSAPSARSPRKAWRYFGRSGRDAAPRHYSDFEEFVAHYALLNAGEVTYLKTYKAKTLRAMLGGKIRENFAPLEGLAQHNLGSTKKIDEKYRRNRAGHMGPVWNWR